MSLSNTLTMSSTVRTELNAPTTEIITTNLKIASPGLLDTLPLELIEIIIEHLEDDKEFPSITNMKAKWALKRVNRFFYSLKSLPPPSDFFVRQHKDIDIDRAKQWALMAAFGPDRTLDLVPCYACRAFLSKANFVMSFAWDNPSMYFYANRTVPICDPCRQYSMLRQYSQPPPQITQISVQSRGARLTQ